MTEQKGSEDAKFDAGTIYIKHLLLKSDQKVLISCTLSFLLSF